MVRYNMMVVYLICSSSESIIHKMQIDMWLQDAHLQLRAVNWDATAKFHVSWSPVRPHQFVCSKVQQGIWS